MGESSCNNVRSAISISLLILLIMSLSCSENSRLFLVLYQFVPVYVVCIMNFMPKEHEVTKFRTDVALREKSSDSMFSDKLRFIYLSLPFFDKSEEECETGFEK